MWYSSTLMLWHTVIRFLPSCLFLLLFDEYSYALTVDHLFCWKETKQIDFSVYIYHTSCHSDSSSPETLISASQRVCCVLHVLSDSYSAAVKQWLYVVPCLGKMHTITQYWMFVFREMVLNINRDWKWLIKQLPNSERNNAWLSKISLNISM